MKMQLVTTVAFVGSALSVRARVIVWFGRVPHCLVMHAHVLS
jgi:hypothetical protein